MTQDSGGGLNDSLLEPARDGPLNGTGGADGGGTLSGGGNATGENSDDRRDAGPASDDQGPDASGMTRAAAGTLAGGSGSEEAIEAAALGPADGSLADAALQASGSGGKTIGDALHGGAGRDIGSGTPGDRGELGGGGPAGLQGGTGPAGVSDPGGGSRQ